MSESQFPRLLSIFYSEFDPIQGPRKIYQITEYLNGPKSFEIKEDFELYSEYIIPKTNLSNKYVVSFYHQDYKILGHPIAIFNKKYARNALMFNVGWTFLKNARTLPFEPLISKFAFSLKRLELEKEFLSNHEKRKSLLLILEHILHDLNNICESRITIGMNFFNFIENEVLDLKIFPFFDNPRTFSPYEVPVLLISVETILEENWDVCSKMVVKEINGVNSVMKICNNLGFDLNLVNSCISHFLFYKCVYMVDIFQFSNIYAVKPTVKNIIENTSLQKECMLYIIIPGLKGPSFPKIFSLYCSFKHGISLKEWDIENQLFQLNIDIRVHKYPICSIDHSGGLSLQLRRLLNGSHHYDEICTEYGCSASKLDELLFSEPAVTFIYK